MRFVDLEPQFLIAEDERTSRYVDALTSDVDGVKFKCPACYAKAGTNVGVHSVVCWFYGRVSDDRSPQPGRWLWSGTSAQDFSLLAAPNTEGRASVQLLGGCNAHFHVRNGEVVMA